MTTPAKIAHDGPVLLVDDSEVDRMIASKCYQRSGLRNEFRTLGSGADLLQYLAASAAGSAPRPAVVLLDINMPGMTGFEVLQQLRSHPDGSQLVVVMFTNSDDPLDRQRAAAVGANGLVTKPMRVDEYTALFHSLVA